MMMGYCGLMAPLARVTALMKTRVQNWPLETDAEIPVFVLVFAIRETGRTQQMPRVRTQFRSNRKPWKRLAGCPYRIRSRLCQFASTRLKWQRRVRIRYAQKSSGLRDV